ncbi:MAG: response regulator [Patescibacteria group bacterium]
MKKYKILLIEDEPGQVLAISSALSSAGYEIVSADDGKEGLAKAKTENPDLILLDIVLPKMDGVAVLNELKKNPQTKEIPVIILTNLATGETMRETMEAGSSDYLVKTDYTLEELVGKIKQVLK